MKSTRHSKNRVDPGKGHYQTEVKGKAMSRKNKLKPASNAPKTTINEKLDEALDESFPASDPVSLGHSERVGQPKPKRKTGGEWPKGSVGLKEKR
jgi:hypothetical protein